MQVIVSDVTYMGREICVAGWYADEMRMVRPLSQVGHHWPKEMAGPDLFCMGNVIELESAGIRNTRGLPHSREDLVVRGRPTVIGTISEDGLAEALSDSESASVAELFQGYLQQNRFVMAGADCPSLGAITVERRTIRFFEKEWQGNKKLRCSFRDGAGGNFQLAVSSVSLRDLWRDGGTEALNDMAGSLGSVHVRIGLAHPFDSGEAYAMFNGLALY